MQTTFRLTFVAFVAVALAGTSTQLDEPAFGQALLRGALREYPKQVDGAFHRFGKTRSFVQTKNVSGERTHKGASKVPDVATQQIVNLERMHNSRRLALAAARFRYGSTANAQEDVIDNLAADLAEEQQENAVLQHINSELEQGLFKVQTVLGNRSEANATAVALAKVSELQQDTLASTRVSMFGLQEHELELARDDSWDEDKMDGELQEGEQSRTTHGDRDAQVPPAIGTLRNAERKMLNAERKAEGLLGKRALFVGIVLTGIAVGTVCLMISLRRKRGPLNFFRVVVSDDDDDSPLSSYRCCWYFYLWFDRLNYRTQMMIMFVLAATTGGFAVVWWLTIGERFAKNARLMYIGAALMVVPILLIQSIMGCETLAFFIDAKNVVVDGVESAKGYVQKATTEFDKDVKKLGHCATSCCGGASRERMPSGVSNKRSAG